MSQPPVRLVHASDFHLERPLGGVAEVPDHLREQFLEAPYRAAERVFETALSEGADALLLAGDIIDVDRAGPRGVVFLHEQFSRLEAAQIPVFWAGGDVDPPDAWPACLPLPKNVRSFPAGRVDSLALERKGKPIARIQGMSRSPTAAPDDAGFHCDPNGLFTIGVSYGTSAPPGAEGDRVNYMALGGQHRRQTVDQSPGIAHYSGTPQGRTPAESAGRGCTVVSVDEAGHVKTKFVATDAVRWLDEAIEITAGTDQQALLGQLLQRSARARDQHPNRDLLVTWNVGGRGELVNQLRPGGASDVLLADLRKRFGSETPALWSVAIQCDEPLDVPAEAYDQETILGDVLRQFRDLSRSKKTPLELEAFLPEGFTDGQHASLANVSDHRREPLIDAAAKLGIQLLHAAEA